MMRIEVVYIPRKHLESNTDLHKMLLYICNFKHEGRLSDLGDPELNYLIQFEMQFLAQIGKYYHTKDI